MTTRELFLKVLIEIKKEQSPHVHLSEFNTLANETISEFIDSVYFTFETSQKSLDYIRPLKKFSIVTIFQDGLYPNSKRFEVPDNYRHITAVETYFKGKRNKCAEEEETFNSSKRLEPDKRAMIHADPFLTPSYKRTYHSLLENTVYIHTGSSTKYTLSKVLFDYIKQPETIELTYSQAFEIDEDTSQELEFSLEGCEKIKDILVTKFLERDQNNRLNSYMSINQMLPLSDIIGNIQQNNIQQ